MAKAFGRPQEYGFCRTQTEDGKVWRIRCSTEGCIRGVDEKTGESFGTLGALVRDMRGAGWRIGVGLAPLCPQHRAPRDGKVAHLIALPTAALSKPESKPMSESQPDIRLTLNVVEHLQEYFDKTNGRYLNNWSDEKIATTTGAALAFVIKVRREGFGELAEDPIVSQIRLDIAALGAKVDGFKLTCEQEMADIRRRFDSWVQSQRKKAS